MWHFNNKLILSDEDFESNVIHKLSLRFLALLSEYSETTSRRQIFVVYPFFVVVYSQFHVFL